MFTGLVRDIGTVIRVEQRGDLLLEILPSDKNFPLNIGASIACHGICLTVTAITPSNAFRVALSAETVRCTNASNWQLGTKINLEPSLSIGDVLGGHFVSGHVDGIATSVNRTRSGDSAVWEFKAPADLKKFIAHKGSVALDGVSLTVNDVNDDRFTVNIIDHTAKRTHFGYLQVGDSLNLEVDMLARYVARMMETRV